MEYHFFLKHGPAEEIARRQVERDARQARLSPAYRAYYRLLRPLLPLGIRQGLQSAMHRALDDSWYLPDRFLRDLALSLESSGDGLPVIHPWPSGARFALILTHDVETREGFRKMIELADMEQELGFRSSFNIVPYKYPMDAAVLSELQARGFEIGIHGYNHDGRLYASRSIFNRRVPAINDALHRYGARGFRSPMVHRNLEWLQSLDIDYDGSCFDIDPLQPLPGGVGGIWPFVAGRFVELPYTLPQDHSLWIVLGERTNRIWEHKLRYLARRRGMVLMLTHPDYMSTPERVGLYREFLQRLKAEGGCWHALPRQAAAWWRRREASAVEWSEQGGWTVTGPARDGGVPAIAHAREGVLVLEKPAVLAT